jgi:hypothetical protein
VARVCSEDSWLEGHRTHGSYLASRVGGLNAHTKPWVQRRCELCVDVLSAVQTEEAHFWVGCASSGPSSLGGQCALQPAFMFEVPVCVCVCVFRGEGTLDFTY